MSNSLTVDRAFLQTLLACAFALQQSQADSPSLSATGEGERLTTSGGLDGDVEHLIVDDKQNVTNNNGAVTGLKGGGFQVPLPRLEEDDRSSGAFLSYLASTLYANGGAASADAALDLVLSDIAEQARQSTNASAAAIALRRGEEMVCRARTGKSAPELGAPFELPGDCIQPSEALRCDDTEADSRADAVVCRRHEIRSFLIFPLLKQGELVGLFEIFSSRPGAFGDRDVQILQGLSRQVLIDLNCATEIPSCPPENEPQTAADNMNACFESFRVRPPEVKTAQFRLPDPWKRLPVIVVIAFALLLGWMLGRITWPGIMGKKRPAVAGSVSQAVGARPALGVTARPDPIAQPEENRHAPPSRPPAPVPPKAISPEAPSDSLVVYENGKVIFQLKPLETVGPSSPESGETISHQVEALNEPSATQGKAEARLLQGVEPEYPEAARHQHIQGLVILEVSVGKDGGVQELTVLSGNSMLAIAASDAVRKWRFRPLLQNGRAVQFLTRIKVDFVLP
ncbi:MAG TPA: TonB family protein [Candidatus Eremiobacteraceae bacterium]|nr:TonB family protein [Candidatus Eremiobacteraceae bacterium]